MADQNDAQPYQDFIDRLFYRMAGLTEDESAGLEERLARMLQARVHETAHALPCS